MIRRSLAKFSQWISNHRQSIGSKMGNNEWWW